MTPHMIPDSAATPERSRAMTRLARIAAWLAFGALAGFSGCQCTDCPEDDFNGCTIESCQNGQTVHEDLPAGSICHEGGNTGICQGRRCLIPCSSKIECDDGNPCTADGCDAQGFCVHVNSDTPPSDGNICTLDGCVNGQEIHPPVVDGTVCGKGHCAGGVCDFCMTEQDCGTSTTCLDWRCEGHVCVPHYVDAGTPIPSEVILGDCRARVCDGLGHVVEVPYEEDKPPDDGSPCTKETCIGWTPVHEPIPVESWCLGGICNAEGQCVECLETKHCSSGAPYCFDAHCFSCSNGLQDGNETGVDCGGSCPKCLGDPCSQAVECKSTHCADGVCCDVTCGTCYACDVPGFMGLCKAVAKNDEDPPSCAGASACNGAGTCKTALGYPCMTGFECASNICKNGYCVAVP